MNKLSQHKPNHSQTELQSRATSSSRSKWNELKGKFSRSDSSTILSMPTVVSSSSWSFFIVVGFLMSSDIAHSMAVEDVSIAPTSMSYTHITKLKLN
ncbi:hypothetical protein G4B88_008857 [Cannabis sativa]|uniref:Uncharacterized protein n=1 Tax=Cannabis sativa TaxID=3483 RepID=A0A7J6HQ73_CANSA|nr:hypothetical protein G4B88_008857 [Cannabis sativa]